MELSIIIIIAYILDLLCGDPRWFPHPVKGIGWLSKKLEPISRKLIPNPKLAGYFFTGAIVSLSFFLAWLTIKIAYTINSYLGFAISTMLIYNSLSIKDLKIHAMQIYAALAKKDLNKAKKALSMIVGRDTAHLEETAIIAATIETTAENTVDGIIAPLFFSFIGAAPLAIAYKAINTLDSLVGYKNERYKDFGTASAKLDDIANFLPARLSLLLLTIAAYISGHNGLQAFKIGLRDRKKHLSPNSAIPESIIAGALNIRLGGPSLYQGKTVNKPYLGDDLKKIIIEDIPVGLSIIYICACLSVITGVLTRTIIIISAKYFL